MLDPGVLDAALLPTGPDPQLEAFDESSEFFGETLDALLLSFPGGNRTSNVTELAELVSGTSDKKSKEYKAARKKVERWSPSEKARAKGARPERPGKRSQSQLRSARRQQSERLRALRERGGDMKALIRWLSGFRRRPEWVPSGQWIHIPREVMRRVIKLWAEQQGGAAADMLWSEFLSRYIRSDVEMKNWQRDVEVIAVDLLPSKSGDAGVERFKRPPRKRKKRKP